MANANNIVTYWKEKRTGCIYKYYGHTKPYMTERYTQVASYDYYKALEDAHKRWLARA